MAELSQIMEEVRSYTGGSFNKFKRGVVYDPSIGKKISVTIVATGFEINSLPHIDMDPEDANVDRLEGEIWTDENDDTNDTSNENEETMISAPKVQEYVRPEGKPALILGPGDDIRELERVPAYIRRNKKLTGIITDFQ